MDTLYSSDSISFSPNFVEPRQIGLMSTSWEWQVTSTEYAAGLNPREMASLSRSVHNIMQVQPSILPSINRKDAAFRPSDATVDDIYRFYQGNWNCSLSERLRFDEVADISTSEYTFMIRKDQTEPIYTRHPISNIVTKHEHPFNTLPRFSLSVHPVFVVTQAYGMLLWHGDVSDKIREIGYMATRSLGDDFLQMQVPSTSAKSPPMSCPRFRTTASSSATSCRPENSGCKRRRVCEVPSGSGVAEWVDQICAVTFDELPQDDVVLYSSEPSKPYAMVVERDQAWLAVAERKRKRRRLGKVPSKSRESGAM